MTGRDDHGRGRPRGDVHRRFTVGMGKPRASVVHFGAFSDRRYFPCSMMVLTFIFMPFGPIMSPGTMSDGQGPIHLASWTMV